ncbi:TolC family protein [Hydrogenimonas sp. SS33]|uniref:TolC family protein n=1 Tax=Hydrogenimonas leucolamina TaxID=2954236 RepID=UPI00336C1AF5
MVSNASLLRWIACSLLGGSLLLAGQGPEALLSKLKRQTLQLQHEKNRADSTQLKWSWINPVTVGYYDSRNTQFDRTQISKEFSIRVDQPIFKSGGILYAVKYAAATRRVGDLAIEAQERKLIKEVVATLFDFRINRYRIAKQKLLIENDRIDIERKKEAYLSGDLDSGFLDQAILKKNRDTLQLYTLQDTRAQLHRTFKNLSDADAETVTLPHFTIMEKAHFLRNDIDLLQLRHRVEQKRDFKTMTLSRYLPTLSLQASYVKPYENSYYFTGGRYPGLGDDYYTYGFRVTMPIDIKAWPTFESARVDHLVAEVQLLDKRREADNTYDAAMKRLKVLDRMIALSKEDEKLYDSLVTSTKEQMEAGEKTAYDLKTMKNSKKIRQIDRKIFQLQKQLVLLDLYEKSYTKGEK